MNGVEYSRSIYCIMTMYVWSNENVFGSLTYEKSGATHLHAYALYFVGSSSKTFGFSETNNEVIMRPEIPPNIEFFRRHVFGTTSFCNLH